jgi:hypothetical protein
MCQNCKNVPRHPRTIQRISRVAHETSSVHQLQWCGGTTSKWCRRTQYPYRDRNCQGYDATHTHALAQPILTRPLARCAGLRFTIVSLNGIQESQQLNYSVESKVHVNSYFAHECGSVQDSSLTQKFKMRRKSLSGNHERGRVNSWIFKPKFPIGDTPVSRSLR